MRTLTLILCSTLVLVSPAAAQSAKGRESTEIRLQRLLDKEEITNVLLEYGRSLDARDFATYSSLFATDGEWVGGFGTVKGPANIKALMEKTLGSGGNKSGNYHLLSNFVITVNGDTATAWSRWTFVQPGERGASIAQAGRYEDQFVRENGAWKFKRRTAASDAGGRSRAAASATAAPAEAPAAPAK
jgi:ketosteroid isomerase-like protein